MMRRGFSQPFDGLRASGVFDDDDPSQLGSLKPALARWTLHHVCDYV
jgi:hypothetical protein